MPAARLAVASEARLVQMAQVFRHQHSHVFAYQLALHIAEGSLRGFVDEDDAALRVNGDDGIRSRLGQRAKTILALLQGLFGLLALNQLAYLNAYGREHLYQCVITLAHLAAEEFYDAEDFTLQEHRETEGALETFSGGNTPSWKILVLREV